MKDHVSRRAEKLRSLTPKQIVKELDKYIVGQEKAKKSVAIALRNRWRRQMVEEDLRDEILPNNIIMIGPTGVGKTEIARRLAKLTGAPFIKVEASKFTEVGYVGRDVESMVRDLVELAVNMAKSEKSEEVEDLAYERAEERILDLLLPPLPKKSSLPETPEEAQRMESWRKSRSKLKEKLDNGELEEREVEIEVRSRVMPTVEIFSSAGLEEMDMNLQDTLGAFLPTKKKRRKVTVEEAREILFQEEVERLIDMDKVIAEALDRVENSGIIFIDEIDKVASATGPKSGPDVSREGVQRDILPLVEGCNVPTKYGMVKSDHILFIAAGAFHGVKPSDLLPELQGRFPIRVELQSLSREDFVRILQEPKNALIKQYQALLRSEGVEVAFDQDAIEEIAEIATRVNAEAENIGARRLHTVLTTLLEDYLFDLTGQKDKKLRITREYVSEKLREIVSDRDLSKYIL